MPFRQAPPPSPLKPARSQQNASGVTFHTRSDPARSELTFPVGEKQASYQVALTRAENKSYLKKGTDTRP
ncbi:hypothetical protein SNOG_12822 [Parastagonospora nodorum SN15]|uniref:Uncharacterized protein n=1 Tax=Phaeosphaeria nodorum (strain SN15 / ATCC MYA-4574 / FGSC 10173) TaxID=321614 RepID=Q0U5Z2_PHANO|nr:hypothetical protein SNOG_12822 [Parastagonospora nodorum SN15]EAT79622.1 hypothetical protein SNOG_12822 [Parastagonospora nodorum SN15]